MDLARARNFGLLATVVGITAIVAPLLHSVTDVMEWSRHGFSRAQLWLNYAAFLPMPWLLLGIYAVHEREPGPLALGGAILHGIAFTYFAYTTLLALGDHVPDYATLWQRLGITYTVYGGLMVAGGLLFAIGALRARWLPALRCGCLPPASSRTWCSPRFPCRTSRRCWAPRSATPVSSAWALRFSGVRAPPRARYRSGPAAYVLRTAARSTPNTASFSAGLPSVTRTQSFSGGKARATWMPPLENAARMRSAAPGA